MGLGLIVMAWLTILVIAGIPVAVGLAWLSWAKGRRAGQPSELRAVVAAGLPFVMIGIGLVWFLAMDSIR